MSLTEGIRSEPSWRLLAKLVASLIGAGIAYSIWLAAFLLTGNPGNLILRGLLWILAPLMTAAGFAIGIASSERLLTLKKSRFLPVYMWSLIGCGIGASLVYWYGPMLIVFGMFAVGTVAIALREIVQAGKQARLLEDAERKGKGCRE